MPYVCNTSALLLPQFGACQVALDRSLWQLQYADAGMWPTCEVSNASTEAAL
jgi:hypothetical protein